jgi:hypothetical protein
MFSNYCNAAGEKHSRVLHHICRDSKGFGLVAVKEFWSYVQQAIRLLVQVLIREFGIISIKMA